MGLGVTANAPIRTAQKPAGSRLSFEAAGEIFLKTKSESSRAYTIRKLA
jgi:hypothetical protein